MTAASTRRGGRRAWLVHAARAALLIVIVAAIHVQHRRRAAARATASLDAAPLAAIRAIFPEADGLGGPRSGMRARDVVSAAGETLGYVLQTAPVSDDIIGFSGPTNVLIGFASDDRIAGIRILESGDTREHVQQVRQSRRFMTALEGATWEQAKSRQVDAVSDATLTSVAVLEGVIRRLGGGRPSLRFPRQPTLDDARQLFPSAASLKPGDGPLRWRVRDAAGEPLGMLLRTGPAAEQVIGYQGPTEAWVAVDREGDVRGVAVGPSYDNDPYVGYVRDDSYFLSSFNGLTLEQLAELDLVEAQVEGVSGATMTSLAVAESLTAAAEQALAAERAAAEAAETSDAAWSRWTPADWAAMAVILAGALVATTRLRGRRGLRLLFQLTLIGYLGLAHGDLISQAMLVGWAQHGVPWKTAPSLVLLTAAALLLPVARGQNAYCTHLCAHGAVQQLMARVVPWRLRLPRRAVRLLSLIPLLLLAWCLAVALGGWPFSLVDIEPFDAWLYPVAGWATLTVAAAGLLASMLTPMAYCRFGCPTGAVLNYVRRHGRSGRWTAADWAALAMTAAAVAAVAT